MTNQYRSESLEFSNGHDVHRDTTGDAYERPHWLSREAVACNEDPFCCDTWWDADCDEYDARSHPVAYTNSNSVAIEAKCRILPASIAQEPTISAVSILGTIADIPLSQIGGTWSATLTLGTLANTIQYYQPFPINVPIAVPVNGHDHPEVTLTSANSTRADNTMYVTWTDPDVPVLWHTVVDIGCRNANGMGVPHSEPAVVEAVYDGFRTLNVVRAEDDVQLGYWLTDTPNQDLQSLLGDPIGNGSCKSWAELFHASIRAQGIAPGGEIRILVIQPEWWSLGSRLLVPNWYFAGAGSAHWGCDPFTHTDTEATPGDRIPAQGNDDSPEAFVNHWIVRYQDQLFDPSYGSAPTAITNGARPLIDYEAGLAGYERWCSGLVYKKDDSATQELEIVHEYSP